MRTQKQALVMYKRELVLWKLTLETPLEADNSSKKETRARETLEARIALLEKMIASLERVGANA